MTRRLLAFFAPSLLAAQCFVRKDGLVTCPGPVRAKGKPQNGECPVCGTLAHPYHVGVGRTQGAYYPWPGSARLTICAHCNVTFRQWAEGK